jgi:hypothetical protein
LRQQGEGLGEVGGGGVDVGADGVEAGVELSGERTGPLGRQPDRMVRRCRELVREHAGAVWDPERVRAVAETAMRQALQSKDNPADVINVALEVLSAQGCELPAYSTLDRMAGLHVSGRYPFNILATFAEFEVHLLRMRTREGMAVAQTKGRLRGRQPRLSAKQQAELRRMHDSGDYAIADLAELFTVSRPTVYRTLQRSPASPAR